MNEKKPVAFSHLNEKGEANMVDVSEKQVTEREAKAQALVSMNKCCYEALKTGSIDKGDVLSIARVAGIQAAKQTAMLIPLCHPLLLSKVKVDFQFLDAQQQLKIETFCRLKGQTGVEMEALTAASVAALTIYDMCKAIDKGITIKEICLLTKTGGKNGDWVRVTE